MIDIYIQRFIAAALADGSEEAARESVRRDPGLAAIYPDSFHRCGDALLFLVRTTAGKRLIVAGEGTPIYHELTGEAGGGKFMYKQCELTVANSKILRRYFSFTNPRPLAGCDRSIGLGDRLGLASPGHIAVLKGSGIFPVLAQQSMRELNLTGRTYEEVLADAVWAVFQEDYRDGFGADGDHLKTPAEIHAALDAGFTMITLDCSEHIQNPAGKNREDIEGLYAEFAPWIRRDLEQRFLGRAHPVGPLNLEFTPEAMRICAVVYQRAIDFTIRVFRELVEGRGPVDFELSIDETQTSTPPAAHFFIARQLADAGVRLTGLAPRFCGEFQKGIDYIGNVDEFEREFMEHVQIAAAFGYKLSIHSGSDKFRVFPIIGRACRRFHLKTAGTNWLEAVRTIIAVDPGLYREMHRFALAHLAEARRYYHITADPARIPALSSLADSGLLSLMDQDDARQVLHITYGAILQAREKKGGYLFRDRIYDCLYRHESLYAHNLREHIGRHLRMLGI